MPMRSASLYLIQELPIQDIKSGRDNSSKKYVRILLANIKKKFILPAPAAVYGHWRSPPPSNEERKKIILHFETILMRTFNSLEFMKSWSTYQNIGRNKVPRALKT